MHPIRISSIRFIWGLIEQRDLLEYRVYDPCTRLESQCVLALGSFVLLLFQFDSMTVSEAARSFFDKYGGAT